MPGAFIWGAEAEVSAGYARPLDDFYGERDDGVAGALTLATTSPVTPRFALGPALVLSASRIADRGEPIHTTAVLAGGRAVMAIGAGFEATSTLVVGASRRPLAMGADATWSAWAEHVDFGVRYRLGRFAAGASAAYERYDSAPNETSDHLVVAASAAGTFALGAERAEIPALGRMRLQVAAGVGHAALAARCTRNDVGCDQDGFGVALDATVEIADGVGAGAEIVAMGAERVVGPQARWDAGKVVIAFGFGVGRVDDGHGLPFSIATGLALSAGLDVPVWRGAHLGAALVARGAGIRAGADTWLVLAGVAFSVSGCAASR